ncbi:GNAT family N-acetyltransferase [Kitasatospora sp. MMS16-BH015]|uniref:GNAT family N-acetyltransferase n=1 Tax=Kitasatospora sp. MMS16-BH015 TaxID=2018025 RepID=UPI000CF1F62F|nr:GNAT family N-acetyltransferase [Kitasatospora sp. MMS16-BH015]
MELDLAAAAGPTPEVIRTDRLDLLPLTVGHAEEMAAVLDDPSLHTYIGGKPATVATLRSRYERMTAGSGDPAVGWLNWVVRLRAEHRLTGTVQATVTTTPATATAPVTRSAELAWVVGTPWQGRGIATEAALGLADWLRTHGVPDLAAHIHPEHRASAAVAAAIGLTPTDTWQDGERRWH